MRKLIYILGIPMILSGCASLTKTQIESVNQFAQTTKDFSAFPSKIMTGLADIRLERGLFYANSLTIPKLHIEDLDGIYDQKKFDYQVSEKVDVTFRIIDKYSQSLVLLSSDQYEKDLKKQAKKFGVDIDSLIAWNNTIKDAPKVPSGIGSAVNELIILGGKQYVRTRQTKEIKKFVSLADPLIETMTSNLLEYLQSKTIDELIAGEEREITRNYLSFLEHTPKEATIENDRIYLHLKNDIDGIKQLQKQTIAATKDLRTAHKKLLQEIEKKKELKQAIQELQKLVEEMNGLNKTIQKISIHKNQ